MNIVISGGAGFIGSNLAVALVSLGHSVTIFDNLSPQIHGSDPDNSFLYSRVKQICSVVVGDVRNQDDWRKALKGQDVIVHLAAETGTGQSMYEIEKYCNVNINGTAVLLSLITNEKFPIKKIVIASSRAIYGEGKYLCAKHGYVYPETRNEIDLKAAIFDCRCPECQDIVSLYSTDENSKIHPTSIYGITKYTQEEMVHTIGRAIGVSTVAFRYQNVYGPGQSLHNPYTGILSIFSTRIRNGNEVLIFEDGNESRDFVYIDDIVNATILGIDKEEADFHSFNVGTGHPVNVFTVAEILRSEYNSNVSIKITGNYRIGDIRHNYADISKIQAKLGFEAKFSFKDGIKKFVDWVKTQEIPQDNYEQSIKEMAQKGLYK